MNFTIKAGLTMVYAYRAFSGALFGALGLRTCCRFIPSCSHYMEESIKNQGLVAGGWKGFRRLLRCHPFGTQGVDVPPAPSH